MGELIVRVSVVDLSKLADCGAWIEASAQLFRRFQAAVVYSGSVHMAGVVDEGLFFVLGVNRG